MAAFFVAPDPDPIFVLGPWDVAFFRVDIFGCGEIEEASQQGVTVTDEDLGP